jgi:hypothetical protein
VRFPHRRELLLSGEAMADHLVFDSGGRIDIAIAEVKRGRCALNGPWTDPNRQNMDRVLYAIGAMPDAQVPVAAQALYTQGGYSGDQYRIRLFAIGESRNRDLSLQVVQLEWREILTFVFDRLRRYANVKAQHRQWDETGRELYEEVMRHGSRDAFVRCGLQHLTETKYGD